MNRGSVRGNTREITRDKQRAVRNCDNMADVLGYDADDADGENVLYDDAITSVQVR